MRKLSHIINPVVVSKSSDLFVAQPVTFATMSAARDFAQGKVNVTIFSSQYQEDRPMLTSDFEATPDLERSILNLGSFRKKRKLPFIKDILDRLYNAAPDADYLIYTNVDIALQPHFYVAVDDFIDEGYDAFVINRRTIPPKYTKVEEIPLMCSEVGESHPGWDCFVFKRDTYPRFILGDICIGANLIGTVLLFNLLCTSKNFMEFKDKHLTFHIGDDMAWKADDYSDYAAHNIKQTDRILDDLKREYGSIDGDGRYSYLFTFIQNLKRDMKKRDDDIGLKKTKPSGDEKSIGPQMTISSSAQEVPQSRTNEKKINVDNNARVICITGMARSGTSMAARMSNIMGLYLGPEDGLILETDYNVKGCWEHKTLLDISNEIVNKIKLHELQQPGWLELPLIADLEQKARAVIEKDFGDIQFWGWKDDRCSLTLPFWLKIMPQTECIICVRNPIDVAKSLLKQKWVSSLEEGLYRWLTLISSAIRNTHGRRRLIIFYEDFLGEEWKSALRRLAEFFGYSYVEKLPEYEKKVTAFIRKDLRHHNTSLNDFLENPDIPYAVKHFYFMLYTYVKRKGTDGFIDAGSEEEQIIHTFAAFAYSEALQMNHRNIRLSQNKEKIATYSQSLEEQAMQIEALSAALKERDMRIDALLNSLSWKITAPLRRAYESLNSVRKDSK